MSSTTTSPLAGDVVTISFALRPAETRVFDEGTVSFVLGKGGYLPALHEAVASMKEGESQTALAVDAGFGEYLEAAKATLPIKDAPAGLKEGATVMIQTSAGQQRARVTEMTDETFTLDANHPQAGSPYSPPGRSHEPCGAHFIRTVEDSGGQRRTVRPPCVIR